MEDNKQRQPLGKLSLTIDVENSGGVRVTGPIGDPALVFDMLAGGLKALSGHYRERQQKTEPKIVAPGPMIVPPGAVAAGGKR